ncbi:hypothetical protein ColLi_13101 [Colletotrichum liriopes]|uniref:Uncharacterized protein n=1 Tax=Colletotrichum liriopes TaxID=708192 RepID=A0AA37H295_9PEZI|nr:hypothetical protein ColLi_13101 [Colletotrichum liriopes]
MEQDPVLLLQTPDQWPLWPEFDASFSSDFAADEPQPYALQNHNAIVLEPYRPQQTPGLILADIPPSAPLGPDAGLGLGLGWWCMDLVADDLNILASYDSSRDDPFPGPRIAESAEPPCFPFLHDRAPVATPLAITLPPRTRRKRARRQVPQTSPSRVHFGDPKASEACGTREERPGAQARDRKRKAANAIVQPPEPPFHVEAVSGPSTLQASVHTQADRGDGLAVDGGHPQHLGNKRPRSAGPDVSPSPDNAGGPIPSAQVTYLSRPPHQAPLQGPWQGQLPSEMSSVVAVSRGRVGAAYTSGKQRQRKRQDQAARIGGNDVTKASVPIDKYQQHVMNLIEVIKREIA